MRRQIYKTVKVLLLFMAAIGFAYATGTFLPNKYAIDRVTEEARAEHANWAIKLGLHPPSMQYTTNKEFIIELNKCVDFLNFTTQPQDRVPIEMLTGQAVLESGWGTSRFAKEANNLFGIRTWDKSMGILPEGMSKKTAWRVRKFDTKCDSVKEYIRILNTHPAYEEYRKMRDNMLAHNLPLDAKKLIKTLTKFSTTEDYAQRTIRVMGEVEELMKEPEKPKPKK